MASSLPRSRLERDSRSTYSLRFNDRNQKVFNKHTPVNLFTPIIVPRPLPISRTERKQVRYMQQFRSASQKGPLYAVLKPSSKLGSKRAATFDPFEDVDRYTKQFKQESQSVARFDTLPYCTDFFPEELQEVISPRKRPRSRRTKKKGPRLPAAGDDEEEEQDNEAADDKEDVQDSDDALVSDSNVDDDFGDDDSEMAGDYNAEGYFDAGDDDADVLGGDGGEDAADFD